MQHAKISKVRAKICDSTTTLESLLQWETITRDIDPDYTATLFTDHSSTINSINNINAVINNKNTTPKIKNNIYKHDNSLNKLNEIVNTGKAACIYCNGNYPHNQNESCAENITCSFCRTTGHVSVNCFKRINTILQAANYSKINRRSNNTSIQDTKRNNKYRNQNNNSDKKVQNINNEITPTTSGSQNCLKMEFEDYDEFDQNQFNQYNGTFNSFSILSKQIKQNEITISTIL